VLSISDLPALNATLNGTAAIFLALGYAFIRNRHRRAHKWCMLGALLMSALFLTSYVIYHANVGSRPFAGVGAIRYVYFTILITHVVLAAAIVPLVVMTVWRALAERFAEHRRIARITWPLWMYVSVTGVVIYLMLYKM
jgi:uncharacterized membrane protein YozB (DUF420 family)